MTDPAGGESAGRPVGGPGGGPGRGAPKSGRSRYARPASHPRDIALATAAARAAEASAARSPGAATRGNRRRAFVAVARIAGPPVALAVVATAVLVAVAVLLSGSRSVAVNAWLLTIGGLALWTFWRALARALPTAASSAFDIVRDRPVEPPSRLYDVIAIEGAILDAEWSRGGVDHRLRPLLCKIASARLIEHHQVDLETEPVEARRILGEELWALVGPDAQAAAPDAQATAAVAANPQSGRSHLAELAGVAGTADTLGSHADTPLPTEWTHSHHGRRGMPRADIRRAIDLLEAL
jgi:hypothetical protein